MKSLILTLLLVPVLACAKPIKRRTDVKQYPLLDMLTEVYLENMTKAQDDWGFIESDKCDSLLFSGLLGSAGVRVWLYGARDDDGRWYRRWQKDCYPDHSASSISRDMLLGVLWYAWGNKRADIAVNLLQYADKHGYIMGEGPPSRVLMTPALVNTTQLIAFKLGARKYAWKMPEIWAATPKGSARHIQMLHILLRADVLGKLSPGAARRLKAIYRAEPENVLFAAAHNYWIKDTDIPLHDYPMDRLPDTSDWKEPWRPQRSMDDSGRLPSLPLKYHSGGEIVFINHFLQ